MKQHLFIFAGGLIALCLPLLAQKQDISTTAVIPAGREPAVTTPDGETPATMTAAGDYGTKVKTASMAEIKITNLQGEPLGRIQDLVLDLSNGRVVAVLVSSNQKLRLGGTHVAVPPGALIRDAANKVYQIDMSVAAFKDAPLFDLSKAKWDASTQPSQIAADYRYFKQEPYFTIPDPSGQPVPAGMSVVRLGVVERMSKIMEMHVDNLKGERLGTLQTLIMDVPNGVILQAFVVADPTGTLLRFSTIIPPTELTFNIKRDGLLLDDSKAEYAKEARVVFQTGAGGQADSYREEPATFVARPGLLQGTSSSDINLTAQIYKSIQTGKLDKAEKVEVATFKGQVTLGGSVATQAIKDSIGAIAITAVTAANVDNQIVVAPQAQASL